MGSDYHPWPNTITINSNCGGGGGGGGGGEGHRTKNWGGRIVGWKNCGMNELWDCG